MRFNKKADKVNNDDLIAQLMNNGKPTKWFVVKMYVEFTNQFTKINSKVKFHDKVVWGVIITAAVGTFLAIVGGAITAVLRYLGVL